MYQYKLTSQTVDPYAPHSITVNKPDEDYNWELVSSDLHVSGLMVFVWRKLEYRE